MFPAASTCTMAQPARRKNCVLPPAPDPSRNRDPVRKPESGLSIHRIVACSDVSGRGIMGAGDGKSPLANRSLRVAHWSWAAASSKDDGGLVDLCWCQASHSYRRCQIVHWGSSHSWQADDSALPWICCLCCGHSPPASRKTRALRCVFVHGVEIVLCLGSGPFRSPCIASQKITIPGSPFFPSVAFRSDQCCVALAAYLAIAAGAILSRLNSRPV